MPNLIENTKQKIQAVNAMDCLLFFILSWICFIYVSNQVFSPSKSWKVYFIYQYNENM